MKAAAACCGDGDRVVAAAEADDLCHRADADGDVLDPAAAAAAALLLHGNAKVRAAALDALAELPAAPLAPHATAVVKDGLRDEHEIVSSAVVGVLRALARASGDTAAAAATESAIETAAGLLCHTHGGSRAAALHALRALPRERVETASTAEAIVAALRSP